MPNPYLYPINGLREIVDPHKKTVRYEMVTDDGVERLSEKQVARLREWWASLPPSPDVIPAGQSVVDAMRKVIAEKAA